MLTNDLYLGILQAVFGPNAMEKLRPMPELKGKTLSDLREVSEKYNNSITKASATCDIVGSDLGPTRLNPLGIEMPDISDENFLNSAKKIGEEREQVKSEAERVKVQFQERTIPILQQKKIIVDQLIKIEEDFRDIEELQRRSNVYKPEEFERIREGKARRVAVFTNPQSVEQPKKAEKPGTSEPSEDLITASAFVEQAPIPSVRPSERKSKKEAPKKQGSFVIEDEEIKGLYKREIQVLGVLNSARAENRSISPSEIAKEVYPDEKNLDLSTMSIERYIYNLRRKMEGQNATWEIVNTSKRGRGQKASYSLRKKGEAGIDKGRETPRGSNGEQGTPEPVQKPAQREVATGTVSVQENGGRQDTAVTVYKPSESIVPAEVSAVSQRVIELIPEQHLVCLLGSYVDPKTYAQQVRSFAHYAVEVHEGRIPLAAPLAVVGAKNSEKARLTSEIIRQRLAIRVFVGSQDELTKFQYHWNRGLNELIDLLGRRNAQEHLKTVIGNLPDPERALFFQSSSIQLMRYLGHIDVDECDPVRFGTYLRNAAFSPRSERDTIFSELMSALSERIFDETIRPEAVVDALNSLEYADLVIERMIESARNNDFRDSLVVLFSSHPATHHEAVELDDEIRGAGPSR